MQNQDKDPWSNLPSR